MIVNFILKIVYWNEKVLPLGFRVYRNQNIIFSPLKCTNELQVQRILLSYKLNTFPINFIHLGPFFYFYYNVYIIYIYSSWSACFASLGGFKKAMTNLTSTRRTITH